MNSRPGALARTTESVPLWAKLTAALLVLAALGLVATGVAATTVLERYLVNRVDDQLAYFTGSSAAELAAATSCARGARLPGAFYTELVDSDGALIRGNCAPIRDNASPPDLPTVTAGESTERAGRPFTVHADSGARDAWRVVAVPVPLTNGTQGTVLGAASLDDVNSTVSRLRAINIVVGMAVLLALAGCAYVVVRISLRPLREVEQTAEAFAQGDLSQRVPDGPSGTEVGRLTNALNGMLAQIESAFHAREESEAAARASEERMRRFVADASHELRTPLTSIRGFAELYRQGGEVAELPEDEVRRMMRRIEDEARRMGLLVEDLLLLARLDEARPLAAADVDLLTIAADAVADLRALAPDREVSLEVADGSDGPPVVVGDDARLRQVVANLTSNAVAHTPEGTPIVVRVGTTDHADTDDRDRDGDVDGDAGRWAYLEVADRGPGLDAEQRERVFERFYRAEASRSRGRSALSGSGLGLSIVAALVAAHGGRVTVESVPGEGATFRVLLPRAPLPEAATEPRRVRS